MNGRLYRLTPAGGKPNHYTDSYASALRLVHDKELLDLLEVGAKALFANEIKVERVA